MSAIHGGRLFAIARERGWNWRDILDFSASINPLGPSPGVLETIRTAACEIVNYPESHPSELTEALASVWSVNPEEILLGNGATDLIHFLAGQFRDQQVTLCVPIFSEFHRVFPNATFDSADQPDLWPASGVTALTRPVNPTGVVPACEDWLVRTTHPVIVDESFIEFTDAPSLTALIATRPNLIVLRSLTKFYAIPGLRVGAIVAAPDHIAHWKQLRDPWSVNVLAIRAAFAAIADKDHGCRTLHTVRTEREWLAHELSGLDGVTVHPSAANFLFVRLPCLAATLAEFLEDRKILIRNCTGWPGIDGDNAVRIAVRTRPDNERLVAAWREFKCAS
ncbi:MAG: histidinol-phosphate transaminase [Bryobacteraceae bacterium]